MCGIAGILRKDDRNLGHPEDELHAMLQAIRHRGPDNQGVFIQDPIAIGVNRLSIVDPVQRSNQPMTSPCNRFTIAFNGEIYNFRQLRESLIRQGHVFSTESDTDVLLAVYQQNGPQCPSLLRGMFAFAIWDRLSRTLFIARDRLGEKPLYFY